ncbi:MAG: winged helix-turn-helix transcriptional regulator [Clostridia bacterium]|nr:winged helix-turn-helix transcriptional regulator [Clostridia bacterium]
MIGRFEKFTFAISELSRYWHKIASDEMAAYGLKGPYAVYLVTMQRHPDGITAARLCELCEKNKADVSRAMADLEDKGMICRKTDGGNLYRALLVLTDKGKEAATHIKALAEKAVEIGGKGLTDEQRETFYHALEVISSNLKEVSREGLPKTSN